MGPKNQQINKRKNYETKYELNLIVESERIQIEPYPTFLGIKLDPKLCFKPHVESLEKRIIPKINIIKKIKSFKWANSKTLNLKMYKSLIRSVFDYCFIILKCGTEKIKSTLQKMQNRVLKIIKRFPIKTSIQSIHKELKLPMVDERANTLFVKFLTCKIENPNIALEINDYLQKEPINKRFATPLDVFFKKI